MSRQSTVDSRPYGVDSGKSPRPGAVLRSSPPGCGLSGPSTPYCRLSTVDCRLILLLLCFARQAAAFEPGARADEYTQTAWPAVPRGTTVSALVRDRDGALWVGTSEGLLRLEGPRATAYDAARVPGIPEHNISALLEAPDGALWVGARDGGLMRLRGPERTTFQQHDGLPDSDIHALARGPDGTIWVAGGIGVGRVAPRAARGQSLPTGLPHARTQALAVDAAGVAWVGTQSGLLRWDEGGGTWRPEIGPPARAHVEALWADSDGTLWVGTDRDGLWQRDAGGWRAHGATEGLEAGALSAILRDRHGRLWVGSREGRLFWLDGAAFRELPLEHEPCARSIESLAEDDEGGLWLGTTGCGLHRLEGRAVRLVGRRDGLPADLVLGLNGAGDGTVWVGTRGSGLARIAPGGRTEPVTCAPGLPCASCWDIAGGLDGGFHAICRRRLVRWDGHSVVEATVPVGWRGVELVMQASDGALWLAHGKTVVRWKDGQLSSLTAQEPLAGKRVLQEGRDGAVWIATYNGIAVWRAGKVEVFRTALPGVEPTSLCEDGDGGVWLGTKGAGLRRLRDGAFATVTTAQGLPSNWIIQIFEDDAGRLWMSGSKGLFSIGRHELEEVAAGKRPTLHPSIYDAAEGVLIRTDSFGHPAGWKAPDGKLWFATHDGVAIVDPASLRGHPAPRVAFEEVRVGDRRFTGGDAVSVPGRGARDLEAHFVALSFAAPESIAFRHRLFPVETDWRDGAGRTLYYPRLEPGRYQLEVQARHRDGTWGAPAAAVRFELRPPIHREPWFIAAAAATLAALLLLVHRLRLARARAGLHAVMAERARIARDMHDTLAQAFVATSVRLECLDHALESEDRATARKHLDTARRVVRDSLEEARRSVWVLRPQALERGLPAALETLVGGAQGETRVELEVTGTPRPLAPAIETNLLRIAQEAVANAYRHARAKRIILRLAFAAGSVLLSVTDDGTGITERAGGVAQGLTGMKERAAEINGTLSIEGAPSGGTAVRVEVRA